MIAVKKVLEIMGYKAIEVLPERYPGYAADAVRKLVAVISAQTTTEGEQRRHTAVLAELDSLAALVAARRGSS